MKITSVNNELVKETAKLLQKKYRTEYFLLEGEKCVEEAINTGIIIKYLFVEENSQFFKNIKNRIETTSTILSKISSTTTAPNAVAVGEKVKYKWLNTFRRVLLLENIKDAGNLGTIIRTAAAFNIDAIILYGDTVDLYNPKTVRSSVGNLWKIPIFEIQDINFLKDKFVNFEKIATLPKSDDSILLNDFKSPEKFLLMFGSEADGLTSELKDFATKNLTIKMTPKVESLNLSISCGIILYNLFSK